MEREKERSKKKNTLKIPSNPLKWITKSKQTNEHNKKTRIYLIVMDFLVHFLVGAFFLFFKFSSAIQHECARENGHQKKIDVSEKSNNNDRCWTAAQATTATTAASTVVKHHSKLPRTWFKQSGIGITHCAHISMDIHFIIFFCCCYCRRMLMKYNIISSLCPWSSLSVPFI